MPYATGLHLLWLAVPSILKLLVNVPRFILHQFVWRLLLDPAPFTIEFFSPSTLTTILTEAGVIRNEFIDTKNRVVSYRYTQMTAGGIGQVMRLHVEYAFRYKDDGLPSTFVVKQLGVVMKDIVVGCLVDLVGSEYRGYKIVSEFAGDLQPRCYYFARSSFGSGVLLLEDLGHLKHKPSLDGATIPEIQSILRVAAKLHSRTWCEGDKYADTFMIRNAFLDNIAPRSFETCMKGPWGPLLRSRPHLHRAMHALSTYECHSMVYLKTRGWGLNEPYRGQYVKPFGAIGHNDLRLDNVFFTADGSAIAVDWQVCMYRHPLQDVCWTLIDLESTSLGFDPTLPSDTSRFQPIVDDLLIGYLQTLHDELRTQNKTSAPSMTLADAKAQFPLYVMSISKMLIVVFSTVIKEGPRADGNMKKSPQIVQTMAAYTERLDWMLKSCMTEEIYQSICAPPVAEIENYSLNSAQ